MEKREKFASRLGFLLISAGCAIGIGNVWRFPYITGQYGGAAFVLIYLFFLVVLGLPIMAMEFAVGRASRKSCAVSFRVLEPAGTKWHWYAWLGMAGNYLLMMFYTTVAGWMLAYVVKMLRGAFTGASAEAVGGIFNDMLAQPGPQIFWMIVAVVLGFGVCSLGLQNGVEKITKAMMVCLLLLMVALAVRSVTLPGADEGLKFYLVPDFGRLVEQGVGNVVYAAMGQAFFTLSLGIGAMAIFGSYIGKERSLMGESVNIILLDTFVAIVAGLIMFPACFTYGVEVNAGPSLLFDTMATVFNHMNGGRWWGTLFFLFMVFAALSTVLAVCEEILAMVRDLTGWSRPVGCLVCGGCIFLVALTTALGYSVLHFQPFAEGTSWLDLWDFLVSNNILPLGSLVFALFCCNRFGWGWDSFLLEANAGRGLKVRQWMKPMFQYVVPVAILFIYVYGMVTFQWK